MNVKQLQAEIGETLLRNLSILKDAVEGRKNVSRDSSGFVMLPESEVYDMLRATAANLAQVYAHRVAEDDVES